jgi:hypothetical protein
MAVKHRSVSADAACGKVAKPNRTRAKLVPPAEVTSLATALGSRNKKRGTKLQVAPGAVFMPVTRCAELLSERHSERGAAADKERVGCVLHVERDGRTGRYLHANRRGRRGAVEPVHHCSRLRLTHRLISAKRLCGCNTSQAGRRRKRGNERMRNKRAVVFLFIAFGNAAVWIVMN